MILGALDRRGDGEALADGLAHAATAAAGDGRDAREPRVWARGRIALCWAPSGIATLDEAPQPFVNEDRSIAAVCAGKVYNGAEMRDALASAHRFATDCPNEVLVHLYEKHGEAFLESPNGKFAIAIWDDRNRRLVLGRDRLGIEPLFYFDDGGRVVFGSSMRVLLHTPWIPKALDPDAVLQYLLYSYNPSHSTLVAGVRRLPPGHLLTVEDSQSELRRYWRLSFADSRSRTEERYCDEIVERIEEAVRIRLENDRAPGLFLSGGTDSSAILSITSKLCSEPLQTFSFRCHGKSYDESAWARFVAERHGARHTEIDYGPEALRLVADAVAAMDEPFCDIGIEIGTYLLGRAAQNRVSYVFSGEGGDELFAGHPVYVADKFAAVADRIPRALLGPMARVLQRVPDSPQKSDLRVKLKRFAYGLQFSPELLSHRWRIYYTPSELRELCAAEFLEPCDWDGLLAPVLAHTAKADGGDPLSRSLYSDTQTLVSFYLRRLGLLRALGIESRVPLLDHRLVEYAARVPSQLKLHGLSEGKFIYRKALERVVSPRILYERPKLGHSVPMKNWLRDDEPLRNWVSETLSGEWLIKRGIFRPAAVQRLIQEHRTGRHNHSHRLWGLVVLELWMRKWLDG